MTPRMSKASRLPARKRQSRWEKRDERYSHFRPAVCPDADGHADFDFARPHGSDLPVYDDAGADRKRRPETVFGPRQFRHHGDSVFHPCRHLPDPGRRRASHDRVYDLAGRPFSGRSWASRRRGLRDVCRDLGVEHGYPKRFGVGVISTSGALGILVPPSIILVLYGVSTNTSIGALFMAGVVPGILLASTLGALTFVIAWRKGYPRMPRATWTQRLHAFRESVWGLLLIAIVLGGIYGGIFTPTEAAAVAAVYAFFITVFVYKELRLREVSKVLLQAASMSSMLLYIITNAVLFSFLMTHEQIPQELAAWIIDKNFSVWMFLLVVNIILLLAGNVMDPSSILLIMAPILFPLATKLGVHPVHLGVLMIVNTEVGLCHPPVGLNLYIASSIAKMGISEITIAVLPWLCAMLVFLGLITYVPEISLWLPRLLGMI